MIISLLGVLSLLSGIVSEASADNAAITKPTSLAVLDGLPRPRFSLAGASPDFAAYLRNPEQFNNYMDLLSEQLERDGAGAFFSFDASDAPDDPRAYAQSIVVWACVGVAWFLVAGLVACGMCGGRCCCGGREGLVCCGRKYPTVKGGVYSRKQRGVAYAWMALFVVATSVFLGLAQGRGNAGLTEAQKRLARGAGYGAARAARAHAAGLGPLLQAYAAAVTTFSVDMNATATAAIDPRALERAASCGGSIGAQARNAAAYYGDFVAAADALALNPFCDAALDAFGEKANAALALRFNVSCGSLLKGLLVSANASFAHVPRVFWDAVEEIEKGVQVNSAGDLANVNVTATIEDTKKLRDDAKANFGIDCCPANGAPPTAFDKNQCDSYWEGKNGGKDALAQARSQAVTARDMAASIEEKIAGPADEVAKLAKKYARYVYEDLGAALAPIRAPSLAATLRDRGVAAAIGDVAAALRGIFDPWGVDVELLEDTTAAGSDVDVARAATGGDAEPTVTRARRILAAVEDRGDARNPEGVLGAHGPWYYVTRVMQSLDWANQPGSDAGVWFPSAASLSAAAEALGAGRTMLVFGSYDKAGSDTVTPYPAALAAGATADSAVACVTDQCVNNTIDYLNARVLPLPGGPPRGGGYDGGAGGGAGGPSGGRSNGGRRGGGRDYAFMGIEGVLLNPEHRAGGVDRELLMLLPALLVLVLVLAGFFAVVATAAAQGCASTPRDGHGAGDGPMAGGKAPSVGCGSRLSCCVAVGSLLLAPWCFLLAGGAPFPLLLAAGDACGSGRPLLQERGAAMLAGSRFCGGTGGYGGANTCVVGGESVGLAPRQTWHIDAAGVFAGVVGGRCDANGEAALAGLWRGAGEVLRAQLSRPDGPIDTLLRRLNGTAGAAALRGKPMGITRAFADDLADATFEGVAGYGAVGAPGSCAALHAAFAAAWNPVCGGGGLVDGWYWAAAGTYLVAFALLCCGAPAGVLGHKRFAPAAATRAWQRRGLRAAGGGGGGAQDDDEDYESPVYRDNPLRNDGGARDIENGNGNGASAAGAVPTAHPVQRRSLSFRERWFGGPSPTSSLRTMDADGGTAAGAVASAPPVQEIELADRERALAASRADAGLPVAVSVVGDEAPAAQRGSRATMLPGDYALAAGMPAANNNNDENNLDDLTTAQEDAVPAFYHPNSGSPTAASAPPADGEVVSVS